MKKIAIFGTGYVGLVTGACLASAGMKVVCVDIEERKIKMLEEGECPIIEKDLPERIKKGVKTGNLFFTTDAKTAIEECDVIFIAVGTPTKKDSEEADLSAVFAVAETINKHATKRKIVVQKSTVPVGTGSQIEEFFMGKAEGGHGIAFFHAVVSNPEFLKEGNAVKDFESPDRVVIGTSDEDAKKVMSRIYAPFMRTAVGTTDRMIFMSRPSAELTKVFANTMLAMRISAMNAITELAEKFDADAKEIRKGIGSDSRIGPDFLFPGGATFGGSCFPKDVRALIAVMEKAGIDAKLFREVMNVNREQRMRFVVKIFEQLDCSVSESKIAIWGLSFKPGTDDVREAASLDVVQSILDGGGKVALFDAHAKESFRVAFGERAGVEYCDDQYEAIKGADALVILTDAMEFRSLDFEKLHSLMNKVVICDGKNLHDPEEMANEGVQYVCMGRPVFTAKKST
ncbi:UDP-glucose/GDP-mannose dehydrogenase family protein [bacterium]|jgi:UDPglucose 6-dehydrogenase|nr:UDP-glucose/GDP-mannose dehydrogenase family protein [bacterium]MBT4251277.1 UDP-glucose/GDP-mannose dehydrogenase family protein [bacterium]MBT4598342.1 UDP-glucose/GDP-mannose dehydrogenase family protein [bacterium]MBT6754175.1 UDP-glucose/GDP-mannose dehydrogenase family protein [bacterium]MBT7037233.1 UDP-glucose/GDP-mannose dehydrogenase family protein [bacterium]